MNQPPPIPAKPRRLRALLLIAALISTAIYFRGYVGCMLYPECNPLLSVSEMPPWDVPTNPVEKAGYDFAHALQLPDGVPKPVPFDFRAARIKAIESNLSAFEIHQDVAQQYFDHLCRSEAGVQILDRATDVDGVRLLRTPYDLIGAPDHDRFGTENAFSIRVGGRSDLDRMPHGLPVEFVQPVNGRYQFLEQPEVVEAEKVVRFTRMLHPSPPAGFQNGVSSNRRIDGVWRHFELPLMVVPERAAASRAEYGITWRGIRRSRDREFAIAGGELIVVEISTSRVMAINRSFVLSGRDHRPSRIWWANAKSCGVDRRSESIPRIVALAERVLVPRPDVNASFINPPTN